MTIYIILALLLLLLSQYRYAGIAFSFFILFIVSSLRADSVGRDHLAFKLAFLYEISDYRIADLLKKYEIGWMTVNLFVKDYFNDFQVVVAIAAMLTLYPIYRTMKNMSLHMGFALLLYFLLFYYCLSFSLIRQFIAISFFILSVYHFEKNNTVKFMITIVCAAIFHYSVFGMILILFGVRAVSVSYKTVLITIIVTFLVGFSGLTDNIRSLIELLPFEKYAHYADYKADATFDRLNVYLYEALLFRYGVKQFVHINITC
ncbi:MAG: EpsG family protein [Sphingobacteriaceae bacterium]|nr:MAG: EpsG family protein [Sphingobacteriaceae bacterium]